MKSKLLILLFFVVARTSLAQNEITSITAPSQVALNTNASVTINYVANVSGTYQFQVFPKNPDNSPNFAAGGTGIFAGGTLPAAPSGGVFTSSPTDLFVANSETLGDYVWFIKITVGGVDYFPSTNQLVSIVNTINQPSNAITSVNAPGQVAINTNASVTINYVANAEGTYQFQVFPKNTDNSINFAAGGTTIFAGGTLPIATSGGVFTSNPTDLFVDSNTVTVGNYIWFIKITVASVDYFAPMNPLVSVVTTLSANSFLIDSKEMFVNHKLKSLEINTTNLASESAIIYDITGKRVQNLIKLKETKFVDLSNLHRGIYILVTNDNRKLKFIL
jgi:hypothetical protein